jgi:hypothetical protein
VGFGGLSEFFIGVGAVEGLDGAFHFTVGKVAAVF